MSVDMLLVQRDAVIADQTATIARMTAQLAEDRAGRGAVISAACDIAFNADFEAQGNQGVALEIAAINPDATAALAEYVRPYVERAEAAEAELARLRKGLWEYQDTLCEGFCEDVPEGYCDETMLNDCGGCLARAMLKGDAK